MENHTTDPDHHHLAPGEQLFHAEALAASLAAQMWEMDLLEEKQLAYNDLKDAIHKFAARIFTKKFYNEGVCHQVLPASFRPRKRLLNLRRRGQI